MSINVTGGKVMRSQCEVLTTQATVHLYIHVMIAQWNNECSQTRIQPELRSINPKDEHENLCDLIGQFLLHYEQRMTTSQSATSEPNLESKLLWQNRDRSKYIFDLLVAGEIEG